MATIRLRHALGGLVTAGGGVLWAVALIALSVVHPGLDSRLILVPFVAMALTGLGIGLTVSPWRPMTDPRGWGVYLVAAGALAVVPLVGLLGVGLWLMGTPLLGWALVRQGRGFGGALLLVGSVLFVLTRPWILGPVQTGEMLALQEVVERALAVIVGGGWVLVGLGESLSAAAAPRTSRASRGSRPRPSRPR